MLINNRMKHHNISILCPHYEPAANFPECSSEARLPVALQSTEWSAGGNNQLRLQQIQMEKERLRIKQDLLRQRPQVRPHTHTHTPHTHTPVRTFVLTCYDAHSLLLRKWAWSVLCVLAVLVAYFCWYVSYNCAGCFDRLLAKVWSTLHLKHLLHFVLSRYCV